MRSASSLSALVVIATIIMAAVVGVVATPALTPTAVWASANNQLHLNGSPVRLHGLGSTSTEYLLRGVGMKSWCSYNWGDPSTVIETLNAAEVSAIVGIVTQAKADGIVPAIRIPLTASYWMGVPTKAASANFNKYPNLGNQYQTLIEALVANYTASGVVPILDLHWNDDDTQQQPMALKVRADGGPTSSAIDFWTSMAQTFGGNPNVFFELYNEPHTDAATWMNGTSQYAGMLELISAVRAHAPNTMLVIAGAAAYAYDADSLVQLDKVLQAQGEKNVVYNFHPYMGPAQAGASNKCPSGFDAMLNEVHSNTDKPTIITEFGQACCATAGACESCPASSNGYDEDVLMACNKYDTSWLPWAWRPAASNPGPNCQDLNGGTSPPGFSLIHPTNGQGADWATLWSKYAKM